MDIVEEAKTLLAQKYTPPVYSVAAALRCRPGAVITAVNIDHFLGFVCAETAALAEAINRGLYEFDAVVAVRKNDNSGELEIANMCGKCRQIFHDYAPGIDVVTTDGVKKIEELLPDAFMRQREKIASTVKLQITDTANEIVHE